MSQPLLEAVAFSDVEGVPVPIRRLLAEDIYARTIKILGADWVNLKRMCSATQPRPIDQRRLVKLKGRQRSFVVWKKIVHWVIFRLGCSKRGSRNGANTECDDSSRALHSR